MSSRMSSSTSGIGSSASSTVNGAGVGMNGNGVGGGGGGNNNNHSSSSPGAIPGAGDQLSRTNLYIRGLPQNTSDKDLLQLCGRCVLLSRVFSPPSHARESDSVEGKERKKVNQCPLPLLSLLVPFASPLSARSLFLALFSFHKSPPFQSVLDSLSLSLFSAGLMIQVIRFLK